MLWFRLAAGIALILTLVLSLCVLLSVLVMCTSPGNERGMDSDPSYNGTFTFYMFVILAEMLMTSASIFGSVIALRIWKNNHQMNNRLRHLFTVWLSHLGVSTVATLAFGIMGLVRNREPQEHIVSLYEIFSRYNQDMKFVGSFERFQRENSCCGVKSPEDWYLPRMKQGGMASMNFYGWPTMGESAMMGMNPYGMMENPSTGKCHLPPPNSPLGCGKKLVEVIQYTMALYSTLLILQTVCAIVTAAFSWYCFFYWIETEVVIIPHEELSNLIVIENQDSNATSTNGLLNDNQLMPASWGGRKYFAEGRKYTHYRRSGGRNSRANFNYRYNPSPQPTSSNLPKYRGTGRNNNGNSEGPSRFYYPNSNREVNCGRNCTQFSNFQGSTPSVGGPHAAYHYPERSRNTDRPDINRNNRFSQQSEYFGVLDGSSINTRSTSQERYIRGNMSREREVKVAAVRGAPSVSRYPQSQQQNNNFNQRNYYDHNNYQFQQNNANSYNSGRQQYTTNRSMQK